MQRVRLSMRGRLRLFLRRRRLRRLHMQLLPVVGRLPALLESNALRLLIQVVMAGSIRFDPAIGVIFGRIALPFKKRIFQRIDLNHVRSSRGSGNS
jgi:hypothetical protein